MNSNQMAKIELSVTKNGRTYTLTVPMGAPHGEIYDACFTFLEDVIEMVKNSAAKMNPAPAVPVETPSVEPEIVNN